MNPSTRLIFAVVVAASAAEAFGKFQDRIASWGIEGVHDVKCNAFGNEYTFTAVAPRNGAASFMEV